MVECLQLLTEGMVYLMGEGIGMVECLQLLTEGMVYLMGEGGDG